MDEQEKTALARLAAGEPLSPDEVEIYARYVERMKAEGVSDIARWSSNAVFAPAWDERTRKLAAMLPDKIKTVVDIGCGTMALRSMLPPTLRYVPVDVAPRGADTVVIDLNASPPPPLPPGDVGFFSGSLEYVLDLRRLIAVLIKTYRYVVCSYAATNNAPDQIQQRRRGGWVNDLKVSEFVALFEEVNYLPEEMRSHSPHRLFLFFRRAVRPPL
ncbi:hypothetical protein [Labrys wisconsinensis]|uniref:Methyltransferase type 11 domain-containing protein n=1 Tax=Labrys wisconsinensis TaxID=425677 RepID=A0ABU0JEX6_9HYPH|nr:hypothetical protein [Labrys wisconsinensis]MDQ0472837.1 hypothetical protein [Labrys wisconsinensis]